MQKFSNIFIRIVVGIALAITFTALGYHVAQRIEKPVQEEVHDDVATVTLMLDTGDAIKTFTELPYHQDETVFDLLTSLASSSDIKLSTKDYGGDLGVFIESINGVGRGDKNKWWQFWVNNQYSTVGASAYILRPGDDVVFKFTGNQQK